MKIVNLVNGRHYDGFDDVHAAVRGALGVAYRHLERINTCQLPPTPAILQEIEHSIQAADTVVAQMQLVPDGWVPQEDVRSADQIAPRLDTMPRDGIVQWIDSAMHACNAAAEHEAQFVGTKHSLWRLIYETAAVQLQLAKDILLKIS